MDSNKENTSGRKGLVIVLFVVLGIVIAILAFMNYRKSSELESTTKQLEQKTDDLNKKIEEITSLKTELEDIKAQRDAMGLKSDSLEFKIQGLNALIKDLKTKSAAGYAKFKDVEKQLSLLRKQKDELLAEIEKVKSQNQELNSTVETLSNEKSQLGDSISNLKTTKSDLEAKVAIASILKAESIKLEIMDAKGKVREGEEFKARKIDKLKVMFNLADNKVAKKDKKNIYFRLIEPSGAALMDMATGGGSIEVDGKNISYTAKQIIDFTNTKQLVTFVYTKGSDYSKGNHKIEIYQDANLIGETSFLVK